MLIPVSKNRVYENVSAQIRKQIEEGIWQEGDRIQGELELAKLFEVSRGSVREAIKSLQMAGILEAHSGQGTFVAQNALQKIKDGHLADMLNDAEYYDEVVECRYIIETQAAYIAAKVCTERDIQYLRENHRKMMECSQAGKIREMNRYGMEFHYHIISLMKNEIMSAIYDSILQPLLEEREEYNRDNDGSVVMQRHMEHLTLVEAFEKHDAALARRLMEEHLGRKMRKKKLL